VNLVFSPQAWDDYQHWIKTDKAMLKRLNRLIDDTKREPYGGIGKPEPLVANLSGYWSKRITDEHRLVYRVDGDNLFIAQARYHYSS
jgi:toxin YoeB